MKLMPKLDTHVAIDADLQTIWRVLLDRIENPDRYVQGVESYEFVENTDDYAVRDLNIGGLILREKISINEEQGEVRYQLVDHPLYAGDVINALIPADPKDPKAKNVVQFRMNWEPLTDEAIAIDRESQSFIQEGLKQGIEFVKNIAEHMQNETDKQN
jgi:Domain of unknown function (DUF1857)